MKTVSIGYTRDDGDFAILATLNNNDEHMSDEDFDELRLALTISLAANTDLQLQMLERQDTPDYVEVEQ
jgi:hypothetical protein